MAAPVRARLVVPDWLLGRFDSLAANAPHYEMSYYGPINMLLTTYFPATSHCLVKPQARFRQPPTPGGRISTDSYGQAVGTFHTDINPDFLVSIGTNALDADVPILIYEAKRSEIAEETSVAQLDRHLEWARRYQQQLAPWQGEVTVFVVLVLGATSQIVVLEPGNTFAHVSPCRVHRQRDSRYPSVYP